MKLIDLDPQFVRFLPEIVVDHMHKREAVQTLNEAQGISFRCPGCVKHDPEFKHRLCIPFRGRGAPPDENGGHQWDIKGGSNFNDLTLTPSINSVGHWHGFITNGEIVGDI